MIQEDSPEIKVKKMYGQDLWVRIFTYIRFWTGSFKEIQKYIPKKGNIVDIGCGYGIFANYLGLCSLKRKILGVDLDKNKIEKAYRGLENVSFRNGDATKMQFEKLDCFILHNVLHHLESYDQQQELVAECFKMLKKNGLLFIIEIDKYSLWKLILTRIVDFVMYKGDKVFYLYKNDMFSLLSKSFSKKNIKVVKLKNNPFTQLLYICQK